MSQLSRPISDVSEGGWLSTPIYPQINEATPDDSTFVTSNLPIDSFICALAPIGVPEQTPAGTGYSLTVRLRQVGSGTEYVSIALLQGSQVIASQVVTATSSFADYTITLNQTQIDAISSPNLSVQVTAGGILTGCCPYNVIPTTLYASFTTGPLAGISSIPINWGSTTSLWSASGLSYCGGDFQNLAFSCSGSSFTLGGGGPSMLLTTPSANPTSCLPFSWGETYTTYTFGPCGNGTGTVVVTP